MVNSECFCAFYKICMNAKQIDLTFVIHKMSQKWINSSKDPIRYNPGKMYDKEAQTKIYSCITYIKFYELFESDNIQYLNMLIIFEQPKLSQ